MSALVWVGAFLNGIGILAWLYGGYGGGDYAEWAGIALTIIGWIIWVAGDAMHKRMP